MMVIRLTFIALQFLLVSINSALADEVCDENNVLEIIDYTIDPYPMVKGKDTTIVVTANLTSTIPCKSNIIVTLHSAKTCDDEKVPSGKELRMKVGKAYKKFSQYCSPDCPCSDESNNESVVSPGVETYRITIPSPTESGCHDINFIIENVEDGAIIRYVCISKKNIEVVE